MAEQWDELGFKKAGAFSSRLFQAVTYYRFSNLQKSCDI
jgi:hypothetical protein